jgi:hypothetical protein
MDVPDARRLKALEAEYARVKKRVANQTLAIDALKEIAPGRMRSPGDTLLQGHGCPPALDASTSPS